MNNKRKRLKNITCILIGLILSFYLCTFLLKKLKQRAFGHITSGPHISQGEIEPQIIIQRDAAVFLSPNGKIWIWGGGDKDVTFEIWTGFQRGSEVPIPIQSELKFIKIESVSSILLGLDDEGKIWTLGYGHPSLNPTFKKSNPKVFQKRFADKGFIDISAGIEHMIALKNDGTIWTWGENKWDQLGQGHLRDQGLEYPNSSASLLRVGLDSDWVKIKTTNSETYGIKTDGSLWRWGNEPYTNPKPKNRFEKPVQITDRTGWTQIAVDQGMSIFLHNDGSIWGEGKSFINGFLEDFKPTGPGNFGRLGTDNDWKNILMGPHVTIFAQKKDESWWASGYNRLNNLALDPGTRIKTSFKSYVPRLTKLPDTFSPWAMTTGYETTLVMTRDGQLWNSGRILGRARPVSKWNTFAEAINRFNNFAPSLHLPVRLPDHHSGFHRIWGWPPKPEESFYVQEEDPELQQ